MSSDETDKVEVWVGGRKRVPNPRARFGHESIYTTVNFLRVVITRVCMDVLSGSWYTLWTFWSSLVTHISQAYIGLTVSANYNIRTKSMLLG